MQTTRAHLFLISAAMVMKACSTFVALLALVSRNGMPISSAKACNVTVTRHQHHHPSINS